MTEIALDLTTNASPSFKDLKIVNNDLVLITSADEVLQNIIQVISTFFGEWFMDLSIGIDYFNQILVKHPNQETIDSILINSILNVPGVLSLISYSFKQDFVNRILNISFSAQTTSGIVNYTGTTI